MQEIWKDVPEYEGMYQVSNLGRVKSFKFGKEKILKPFLNGSYFKVNLSYKGCCKLFCVHVLVCMTFLNHKPNGFNLVVDHINRNRTDNRLSNLRLVSQRENSINRENNYSSKYPGVFWRKDRSKWVAGIRVKGKYIYLGSSSDEYKAYLMYKEALSKI